MRYYRNPYLCHSWGNKPSQKAREKEYNHKYYQENKDKWKEYNAKDSNAIVDVAQQTVDNAVSNSDKRFKEYTETQSAVNKLKTSKKGAAAFNEASRAGERAFKRYSKALTNSVQTAAASTTVVAGSAAVAGVLEFVSDFSKPAWKRD